MSGVSPDDRMQRLNAYLDGLLPEADRAAFERELAADAELRAALGQQQRVAAALTRLFAPPAAHPFIDRVEAAASKRAAGGRGFAVRRLVSIRRLAVAAALLLAVGLGGWWYARVMTPPQPQWQYVQHTLTEIYEHERLTGFQPKWVCKDESDFVEYTRREVGQALSLPRALLLPSEPGPIKVSGWNYAWAISDRTNYLLARANCQNFLVFIDHLARETQRPTVPENCGLKLYRRELGKLVLYELSPLDAPTLLHQFFLAPEPYPPTPREP